MIYRPKILGSVVPEKSLPAPDVQERSQHRVKIFTVHGTFANEAEWDNWSLGKGDKRQVEECQFVRRLSKALDQRGIALEQEDHTQYNWSGGNSHEERRTAAIGLKKAIEHELAEKERLHGNTYYDGVYVIGHSHGGTVSRLAMNLWDKNFDFYDPENELEFKHDDECSNCKQVRNGEVGPCHRNRPDGVITFGSPFVRFEDRPVGVETVRIGAWVFRILWLAIIGGLFWLAHILGVHSPFEALSTLRGYSPHGLQNAVLVAWPLILYVLFGWYLPRLLTIVEKSAGNNTATRIANAALNTSKYLIIVTAAVFYVAWHKGQTGKLLQTFPTESPAFQFILGWFVLLTIAGFLIFAVPGSILTWLRSDVDGL